MPLDSTPPKVFRLAVASSTRADFGILRHLITLAHSQPRFSLNLIVLGSHLEPDSPSAREIQEAGITLTFPVPCSPVSDSALSIAQAFGAAATHGAPVLQRCNPDVLLVLGDRYEILGIVSAATLMGIPVAHIHGGEATFGALDDRLRNAITKLASAHFPVAPAYQKRLIQMGEDPRYIAMHGSPGLDELFKKPVLTRDELFQDPVVPPGDTKVLVTFHPETCSKKEPLEQIQPLLKVLRDLPAGVLVTAACKDPGGDTLNASLKELVSQYPDRMRFIESLGRRRYLSCLKHFDLVLGNSSSGLLEAPCFDIPVVNIGNRQLGRLRSSHVWDVENEVHAIQSGIRIALAAGPRGALKNPLRPYILDTSGTASEKILDTLYGWLRHGIPPQKLFFDLPLEGLL